MAFTPNSQINIKKDKIEQLIDGFKQGLTPRAACELAGLPTYYYYKWLNIYEEYINSKEANDEMALDDLDALEGKPILNKDGKIVGYVYTPISLITAIKKACAKWELEKVTKINSGTKKWESSAWLLERRRKNDYAKLDTINATQVNNTVESIKIEYVDPGKEETQNRLELLTREVEESIGGTKN